MPKPQFMHAVKAMRRNDRPVTAREMAVAKRWKSWRFSVC